ncbi:16S rRNA (adenine(1518)-N(6)/adenine(1519)-N(6))-dimethyltransferase RsmA [Bernardetia sp.]|uniref:16S rRNA (adenine(1518)-N(6)/adenine(1519)-N(6))- dimethyltransferase RsmA n=1 Tax=Bernardetia sp. TaxID=1937974 RepID=UPI0025BA82CF|nr:16S rRNA (adenine(1518)-N(6)/adenine(1519)-N(6))-dimethyltransferase RsmA [Bernardetia sp.]
MSKNSPVKPKKHLGQHFLKDENIARKIVNQLEDSSYKNLLEIGAGTGVLTKFILNDKKYDLTVVEIDDESVAYLKENLGFTDDNLLNEDFLKIDLSTVFDEKFGIIGNFPYNISSQIFFKVLDYRNQIPEVVGMIQKEVAERIASPHGNKTYGILSVLLQAFYNIDYCFTVNEKVFNPPPKVKSAVIRLKRNDIEQLDCNEKLFFQLVKFGFNQRRKMLRSALKPLGIPAAFKEKEELNQMLSQRAEQLSVQDFIELTQIFEREREAESEQD